MKTFDFRIVVSGLTLPFLKKELAYPVSYPVNTWPSKIATTAFPSSAHWNYLWRHLIMFLIDGIRTFFFPYFTRRLVFIWLLKEIVSRNTLLSGLLVASFRCVLLATLHGIQQHSCNGFLLRRYHYVKYARIRVFVDLYDGFSRIFCLYTGKYGSGKTLILNFRLLLANS